MELRPLGTQTTLMDVLRRVRRLLPCIPAIALCKHLGRPPWRSLVLLLAIVGMCVLAYAVWSPGKVVRDGRDDLGANGIWLQHGWLGDDEWFTRNERDRSRFRDARKIKALANLLSKHGVRYVFPHLCPCDPRGAIPSVDHAQTELLLDHFQSFQVLPWVGGVLDQHCSPASPGWRRAFVFSATDLLRTHPRLAGIHINIEPLPSGNEYFITLLKELRQALPQGKLLSVAAYPPPTILHPFREVHWDESYTRRVSPHVDQMAVMMYDTAVRLPKFYQHRVSSWTRHVLAWAADSKVLLGLPAYDETGASYHDPNVENLKNSLLGVHAGLADFGSLPKNYQGIAIYCEWEMDDREWNYLESNFSRRL